MRCLNNLLRQQGGGECFVGDFEAAHTGRKEDMGGGLRDDEVVTVEVEGKGKIA